MLYVFLVSAWALAAYSIYNAYYGIRFPEKYIRAGWTVMRGLPKERDSASIGAAISLIAGAGYFGIGLLIIHKLLTPNPDTLPPLP